MYFSKFTSRYSKDVNKLENFSFQTANASLFLTASAVADSDTSALNLSLNRAAAAQELVMSIYVP